MLSDEDTELLCRVGPGTPMGELFRRYWIPALRSGELPEPDCPPVRVRLLGEDLVAFRDSDGRVGLLAEKCSHRRASLFYGRNEECGLRCIYHGWKYDVEGNILDTPAEPAESMIRHHVKHPAYPCHDVNGLIYTYMGPKEQLPLLPNLPWLTLPVDHVRIGRKTINDCNWLQTQEGNLDSVHSGFLHQRAAMDDGEGLVSHGRQYRNQKNSPTFLIEPTDWGVRAIVQYPADEAKVFIRTNTFVMPVYTALPSGGMIDGKLDGYNVNVEVPADDYTTNRYSIMVQRSTAITNTRGGGGANEVAADGRKLMNRANDYMIDREKQRTKVVFSGIDAGNAIQDAAVVETMGPISDRINEHLGLTDTQVVAVRQFLLDAVRDFQQRGRAPGVAFDVEDNDFEDLYLASALVPKDRYWMELLPEITTHKVAAR